MNEVGEMIRQYRMKLGYSQKYLSEKVGITSVALSAIERGVRLPGDEMIYKFSQSSWDIGWAKGKDIPL